MDIRPAVHIFVNNFEELAFFEGGFDEEILNIFVNNFEELAFFESGFDGEILNSCVADEEKEEDWEAEIAIFEKELEIHREKEKSLERKRRMKELYTDALLRTRLGPNTRVRRESLLKWSNSSKLDTVIECD